MHHISDCLASVCESTRLENQTGVCVLEDQTGQCVCVCVCVCGGVGACVGVVVLFCVCFVVWFFGCLLGVCVCVCVCVCECVCCVMAVIAPEWRLTRGRFSAVEFACPCVCWGGVREGKCRGVAREDRRCL